MNLLIATRNPGKLREVAAILQGLSVQLATLEAYPHVPDAIEDADTFEGNARKKALHYARWTNQWSLADDSGLEVDALDGAPGVFSARYAARSERGAEATRLLGREASDASNNAKLIDALKGIPQERRTARFRCVVALARRDEVLAVRSGVFEGRIVDDPRGTNGFGYDPHFYVPEHSMTAAQMPPLLKNAISHRGKALAAIRPELVELLGLEGE